MPELADLQPEVDAGRVGGGDRSVRPTAALVLAIALLIALTFFGSRGRVTSADRTGELTLQALGRARGVYALAHASPDVQARADLPRQERELLGALRTIAAGTHSRRSIRRLALMEHTLGDPNWRATVVRLMDEAAGDDPFGAEEEAALWYRVLGQNTIAAADVSMLRAQVRRLVPGWFGHLALESLYRNAAMSSRARAESRSALNSYALLQALSIAGLLAGFTGLCVGAAALGAYLRCRRHRGGDTAPLPAWLRSAEREPLTREQSDALYMVFVSFLASYAVAQIVVALVVWPLTASHGIRFPQGAAALLSLGELALLLAVPCAVFRRAARRTGLTGRHIGLRSSNPLLDVAYGLGGYVVALPILGIVSIISNWLFRGFSSPLNPALAEYAGARGALVQIVLLAQAAVIVPVVEETLFRGIFFRSLAGRVGVTAAAVIASGVFAVLHPQLPVGFLGIFALGLVFSGLYVLRGSLLPSITAHAINNAVIFAFLTIVLGS